MVIKTSLPAAFRIKGLQDRLTKICVENDIVFLGLFGSFALGKATGKSDVDLLIKFDRLKSKSLLDLIHAESEFRKVFKRKVDLVTVGSLSPYFRKDVLRDVKVIYERR